LANGLNIAHGKVVRRSVAEAFSLPFTPIEKIL
jgi:alanine dehydrogenase